MKSINWIETKLINYYCQLYNYMRAPNTSICHMLCSRQYGFHSYLRELFTCPEPILRYLCVMYKVHKIPVGNHTTKNMIERVQRECEEFTQLYTEDNEVS